MEYPVDPETSPRRKTGPKKKVLVEAIYTGIEVGRGENKKVIDPKEVRKLASIGMKNSEIAEYLDLDDSTLNYNFKQDLIKGKHELRVSLRQAQIKLALSGNATLLIWLGKQYLSQSDSPFDSEGNNPLPWNDDL